MNYYIDFDNTLYETAKLSSLEMDAIANIISVEKNLKFEDVLEDLKANFDSPKANFLTFGKDMAKKYDVDEKIVLNKVNEIIENSQNLTYEDAINFLKRLKEKENKIFILTYIVDGNQEQQQKKLIGSGISNLVDGIIITTKLKYELDLDYKNGIFIDDAPRDLIGLYEKNPIKVIRIRKPNNKRSKVDIDNKDIEEFISFDDIKI